MSDALHRYTILTLEQEQEKANTDVGRIAKYNASISHMLVIFMKQGEILRKIGLRGREGRKKREKFDFEYVYSIYSSR